MYTCEYINWAIENYGEGLTITQEDYDNTIFASGYDYSYTNCKDLAILNDRVYRSFTSWGSGSNYLGTEKNPGPWAYKQIAGNLDAWRDNGYTLEKHGQENGYTQYYAYKSLGGSSLIADGYVDKTNKDNPNTYDVVPVEVNLGKATVEEDKIKVKGEEITVTYNGENEPSEGDPSVVEAAEAITDMLRNSTVSGFLETKIDDSTKSHDDSIKDRLIDKIAASDSIIREELKKAIEDATINSETETKYDKRVDVDLKVADVVKTTTMDATTTLKVAVFDVQPNAKVTVQLTNTETGEVIATRTYETPINNDEITDAISFRVPVNQKENIYAVKVWHKEKNEGVPVAGDESTYGEEEGIKFVQTAANGDKFVELSSDHFSYWTYAIVDVESNASVVIQDEEGNYRSFETLAKAIADWKSSGNGDDISMILMKDAEGVDFGSKEIALDLNGCALTGAVQNAENVTISNADSSNQTTLAATGTYANDVSSFASDGYDTKTSTNPAPVAGVENNELFSTTSGNVYNVEVLAETSTERDSDKEGIDVYAGDKITVKVKVNGARFVAADVTLTYDTDKFELTKSPLTMWDKKDGELRFYNAKSGGGYYKNGQELGTFIFTAKAQTDNVTGDFKVSSKKAYVAGAWSQGWNTESANELKNEEGEKEQLKDNSARIILKNMQASVTPKSGLVYTSKSINLLENGYTAKDSTTGDSITDATIKYALLTKAEVEGTKYTGATGTTESTTVPGYVEGKEPKTPRGDEYLPTIPEQTNAGDYVVFYKISKQGYVTVSDKVDVNIAKANTTIEWIATGFDKVNESTVDGLGKKVTEEYFQRYSEIPTTGAVIPVAKYDNLKINAKAEATVTITSPADTSKLNAVGSYTVTATIDDNYNILNPTCTLRIDGGKIEGYGLQNAEGASVWYDGADHTIAQLVKTEPLTPIIDDVTIQYRLDSGEWIDSKEKPLKDYVVNHVGSYKLEMKISAESYYEYIDSVDFEIKNVEYRVEKSDYVTGWDLVLVYTNDEVPGFKYDMGETGLVKTYNISDLGYELGTVWNAAGTVPTTVGTHYKYVYGLVVFGDADPTKIVPSNEDALNIDRTKTKNRYDVNNSNTVDINDLVAVQGTYNVGDEYFDEQMSIILRADVSGNKKVDTYDCSLVKLNSESVR